MKGVNWTVFAFFAPSELSLKECLAQGLAIKPDFIVFYMLRKYYNSKDANLAKNSLKIYQYLSWYLLNNQLVLG